MPTQIAINNAQTPPTAMPPIGPPDKELYVCFGIVDDLDVGIDVRPAAAGFVEMTVEVGRAVQNLLHVSVQSLESPTGGAPVIGLFCGFLSAFGPGAWARRLAEKRVQASKNYPELEVAGMENKV